MLRTFKCINTALGAYENAGTTKRLFDFFPSLKIELERVNFPLFSTVLRFPGYHDSLDQRNCKIVGCEGRTRQEGSGQHGGTVRCCQSKLQVTNGNRVRDLAWYVCTCSFCSIQNV